jgi:hypothetical protein
MRQLSLGATRRAVATRFLPPCFALYKALSAARSRLSGILIVPPYRARAVAAPILAVTQPPPSSHQISHQRKKANRINSPDGL